MNMIVFPEYMLLPDGTIRSGIALTIESDGQITEVFPFSDRHHTQGSVHRFCGLLLPGLINGHCHLELSWCRGLYPEQAGMESFYNAMSGVHNRRPSEDVVFATIQNALNEMSKNGIVAVADISNTDITLIPKLKSDIYFHTFLEVYGTNPMEANMRFADLIKVRDVFAEEKLSCSLSAHTLMTLSDTLMSLLMTRISNDKTPHSIHFLESTEEKNYFENKTPVRNVHGHESKNVIYDTAAEAACKLFPAKNKILFVHNTFAAIQDIEQIIRRFEDPWFCFCPASNQFITGKLPDVPMIFSQTENILIGTDSLSSNHELNLFSEIDILLREFPMLRAETLFQAVTLNGARFLGIDKQYGSLEKNKKPGLVLLENYRPGQRVFSSLKVKRIV